MIKVGIIDHHLNNFHADKFLTLLRGPLAGEGVEIVSAWESHPTVRIGAPKTTSDARAVRRMRCAA